MTLVSVAFAWLLRPLPPDFLALESAQSTVYVDRYDRELNEEGSALDTLVDPVTLEQSAPHVILAIVAAEDRRFFDHVGIDPWAVLRAVWQNVTELRVVSGGSTLTQQLARLKLTETELLAGELTPARSFRQKLAEARLALRLERTFDKKTLLAAFLNRAPFGNLAVGIEAAAKRYFGVSASGLSLAQAAYLAGLPKGPSQYDPLRRGDAARAREQQVLALMTRRGMVTEGQVAQAVIEVVEPRFHAPPRSARHATSLAATLLADAGVATSGKVRLTIDAALQRTVETIVAEEVPHVYARGGKSAAAVVIDNASGDVLALVGSAFQANSQWGEYNAATAVRQPGSALKPFIYAAALSHGATAATLAADIERPFPDTWGVYMPENYDGLYHGPVRYREALAQSLNVAAVDTLFRVGLAKAFDVLDHAGLKTLDRRPSYFGLGLTLGSGGVRPVDLTNAYAALARGGVFKPWRLVAAVETDEAHRDFPEGSTQRILDARVAYIIGNILSDRNARVPQFGERSILSTPYWAAAKTGTSKGFRDNWTFGYTQTHTVGVWVGDPTGRPMHQMSGVEGAGTIWRRIMNEVTGGRSVAPAPPAGLTRVRVCSVSGERLGSACQGGLDELFLDGTAPTATCGFHRHALIDPGNGLLVAAGCSVPGAESRVVTVYPSPYDAWAVAHEAGLADRVTPRCGAAPSSTDVRVRLLSPAPQETLRIDADVPRAYQALMLQAEVKGGVGPVTFLVDGEPLATVEAPHVTYWPVTAGHHRVQVRYGADGPVSAAHRVLVY